MKQRIIRVLGVAVALLVALTVLNVLGVFG